MSVWVQRSTSSSVYQTASKCPAEVSDAPAGLFAFSDLLAVKRHTTTWPGSQGICADVIFIAAAIILWDYPCQVHLELEFHICAGSRCLYEPEKFLHSARWVCCCSYSISPSSSIYQDVAKQVELWLNCFFFFFATIFFQSILNRRDALFWFMLNLTLKLQCKRSFRERGGTYCHPRKLRYHAINPPYLKETSLCSPLIWRVNLPEYLLSLENLSEPSLFWSHMHNVAGGRQSAASYKLKIHRPS